MPRRRTKPTQNGWNIIPGRNRTPIPATVLDSLGALSLDDDTPTLPPLLKEKLEKKREEVVACEALEGILDVATRMQRQGGNIMLLGLGSLTGATRESALCQLALGLELRERLKGQAEDVLNATVSERKYPAKHCQLVVYDPVFTSVDKSFLSSLPGVIVASDSSPLEKEETVTMLYAPHLEYPVLLASLAQCQPDMVLCNDLQNFVDSQIGGVQPEQMAIVKDILGVSTVASDSKERRRRRKGQRGVEEVNEIISGDKKGEYEALVLTGVDGSDDIGGGRAFNHLAFYWRKHSIDTIIAEHGEIKGGSNGIEGQR